MSSEAHNTQLDKVGTAAGLIGLLGIVFAAYGLFEGWNAGDARPFLGWLLGLGFWLSIAIGATFLTLIWYVFHARWPTIIRRQCEHCMAAFPYLLVLFLPLLAIPYFNENPGLLWKWMNGLNPLPGGHGTVGEDPLYKWKEPYLNREFFVIRALLVFSVFSLSPGCCANGRSIRIKPVTQITCIRRVDYLRLHCSFVRRQLRSARLTGSNRWSTIGFQRCTVFGFSQPAPVRQHVRF